jgi:hypothetical protein
MKVLLISVIILTLIGVLFFAFVKNNETYQYRVLEKFDNFEVRQYDAAIFTSVELDSGNYNSVSSKGFNILAGYIFGDNKEKEKIAMTTPVTMDLKDTMTMRFLVPSKYAKEELPSPNNEEIIIEEMPERIVAAIRFSGWADDKSIEKHRKELEKSLEKEGIKHTGGFTFMGYNAPFDPINRRNEVMVELVDYEK